MPIYIYIILAGTGNPKKNPENPNFSGFTSFSGSARARLKWMPDLDFAGEPPPPPPHNLSSKYYIFNPENSFYPENSR